jgi:hypothetical protein
LITSAYEDNEPIQSFLNAARLDKIRTHSLTDNPQEADIILFVENSRYHSDYFFSRLKTHPFVKKYPGKVFMYNPHDKPWLVLPGLYPSMPKQLFAGGCMAAIPHIEIMNPYIECNFSISPKYLYSFDGTPNSEARRKIFKLQHPRGIVKATYSNIYGNQPVDIKLKYAELITESKFVLSPRGTGTSSLRLFETMRAGRVPVIVSDNWVYPKGPCWDEFALFIPERNIKNIPDILEKEEETWKERSLLARENWERFFAFDTIFNYYIDSLLTLKSTMNVMAPPSRVLHNIAFLKYCARRLIIQNLKASIPILNNLRGTSTHG